MDYLAWAILILAYIFMVAPLIGDVITGGSTYYLEAMKTGAIAHSVVALVVFVIGGILWALYQVTGKI